MTTIVTLLEHYQSSQLVSDSKKFADALISEHVFYMQKHENQNLPEDLQETACGQCEDCLSNESHNQVLH